MQQGIDVRRTEFSAEPALDLATRPPLEPGQAQDPEVARTRPASRQDGNAAGHEEPSLLSRQQTELRILLEPGRHRLVKVVEVNPEGRFVQPLGRQPSAQAVYDDAARHQPQVASPRRAPERRLDVEARAPLIAFSVEHAAQGGLNEVLDVLV